MRSRSILHPFLVLMIALVVNQVIRQLYAPYWEELASSTFGILSGTPDWLAYQNRLLAPYLVFLISLTGVSQVTALKIFVLIAIIAQSFLLYGLLRGMKVSSGRVVLAVLSYSFLFLFVQGYSLYPWDFIDILLFTLAAWGVLTRRSFVFFLILFVIAILNRESALFIGLLIALDAFEIDTAARKFILRSKTRLILGLGLTLAGFLYINAVREFLFISQPNGAMDVKHDSLGNHFNLFKNLSTLFVDNLRTFDFMNSIFLLGSLGYVLSFIKREWKAVALYSIIMLSILTFGVINESRLYGILLPFLIFFTFGTGDFKAEESPS